MIAPDNRDIIIDHNLTQHLGPLPRCQHGMIKEEFNRAVIDWFMSVKNTRKLNHKDFALFGAKWMAERCIAEFEKSPSCQFSEYDPGRPAEVIRQLAKELS